MSADLESEVTNIEGFDKLSIHCSWTAGPAGSFKVFVRNSKASPNNTEAFYELDFGQTLAVSGSDAAIQIVLQQRPGAELKLKWISASGTASDLTAVLSAHTEGA